MSCGQRVRLHALGDGLRADIARLERLWQDGLHAHGGPWLAGSRFTAVDAFFAPVATRFRTYAVDPGSPVLAAYMERLLNWPEFREWEAAGRLET